MTEPAPKMDKSVWIVAALLFLLTPFGSVWAVLWLAKKTAEFDKANAEWSRQSYAQWKEKQL